MKFLYRIFIKNFFLPYEFFIALLGVAVLFVLGFVWSGLFLIAQAALGLFLALVLLEFVILQFNKQAIKGGRIVFNPLSVGDDNKVKIHLTNKFNFTVRTVLYDNPPKQLQLRNLKFSVVLTSGQSHQFEYMIHPTDRGEYEFKNIYVYCSTLTHLVQRKVEIEAASVVPAYPSIIQMKQYELKVFAQTANTGIKKIRRLGHNNEFEQIKNYVQGDDIRTVNWKATSRRNELMVNQYQDEREQQVFTIIDKSRAMRMPFNDLTLLDYAINSTLAFSNVCIRKGDKVGLMTFSDKLGAKLAADRSKHQLSKIMELLYSQKTRFLEANYELLYHGIRNHIKGRSLIMLYTNIESDYALKRVLPMLKRINQKHVLCVIFFENTEVQKTTEMQPKNVKDIYLKTFAEKYTMDNKRVALELRKNGIQTVLTTPENLTIDSINKYLELKARGVI